MIIAEPLDEKKMSTRLFPSIFTKEMCVRCGAGVSIDEIDAQGEIVYYPISPRGPDPNYL